MIRAERLSRPLRMRRARPSARPRLDERPAERLDARIDARLDERLDARLRGERLDARLRALEDRAEIAGVIARYGPAADALDGAAITALWADGGAYSIDGATLTNAAGSEVSEGSHGDTIGAHGDTIGAHGDTIGALVDLAEHRGLVAAGCGHLLTPPDIRLAGDRATAVNHSVVLVHRDDGWQVARLSANRWEFQRTAGGWRVGSRINRLLDGDPVARGLLRPPRPERTGGLQND